MMLVKMLLVMGLKLKGINEIGVMEWLWRNRPQNVIKIIMEY
jgi:hypothetical protein